MKYGLKIYQGHVSWEGLEGHQFLERYNLVPYHDKRSPLLMIGVHSVEDLRILLNHKQWVVIRWCGRDSLRKIVDRIPKTGKIIHTTTLPQVKEFLKTKGINCYLMKRAHTERTYPVPKPLGKKIFVYLPANRAEYHGKETLKKLKTEYEIIVGDGSISMKEWRSGKCDEFYSQVFIGLCLSEYAGGGTTIMEMGIRGIPVVTNVLNEPHCIPWKTIEDIEQAIEQEAKNIGKTNTELAKQVFDSMIDDLDCFDLDKLLK